MKVRNLEKDLLAISLGVHKEVKTQAAERFASGHVRVDVSRLPLDNYLTFYFSFVGSKTGTVGYKCARANWMALQLLVNGTAGRWILFGDAGGPVLQDSLYEDNMSWDSITPEYGYPASVSPHPLCFSTVQVIFRPSHCLLSSALLLNNVVLKKFRDGSSHWSLAL